MRGKCAVAAIVTAAACSPHAATRSTPEIDRGWYAGGSTCSGPQFQVRAYTKDFFILRQAACTNYEKPFLYLIFGSERALLLDTGAGNVDLVTPIDTLLRMRGMRDLVVAHSHAHSDHTAGDTLIAKRANTRVVGRDTAAVRAFFQISHWPTDSGAIDLGGRVIDVLPIPGHQGASIALYDRRTGILLTGDTFYPGRLYVRDTAAFAVSIARLAGFARSHPITHIFGTHIENTNTPYVDYPVETVDQPQEHGLDLTPAQLFELDSLVQSMRGRMTRTVRRDFTIWPLVP
jgi:hydroxyacylglutathione hydrolase